MYSFRVHLTSSIQYGPKTDGGAKEKSLNHLFFFKTSVNDVMPILDSMYHSCEILSYSSNKLKSTLNYENIPLEKGRFYKLSFSIYSESQNESDSILVRVVNPTETEGSIYSSQ